MACHMIGLSSQRFIFQLVQLALMTLTLIGLIRDDNSANSSGRGDSAVPS
jgi:hypothetical protein